VELYPAIDLRAGQVVRARRGDPGSAVVYHADPFAVAEGYARDGARWIHVVDLDRAYGTGNQSALIAELVRRVPLRYQAGGGVSNAEEAEAVFAGGIERVIARPVPGREAAGFQELARRCGAARLAVALDMGQSAADRTVRGAQALTPASAVVLAGTAADAGIRLVVYTALGLEGRLEGTDVAGAVHLAKTAGVEVIVSGGVQSLDEIARIRDAGLAGAVVGRALFERRFTLREALACCSS
jgi:phosphoribosylformimino-5-aminoimidazole carboxamide ribotide isomerase